MKLLSVFISLIIATTAIQNQFLQARNADSNGVESEAASLGCIKRGSNTLCRRNSECCSGSLCLNGRCRKPSGPIKTPPGVVEHESADDIEGVNSNDIEARLEVAFCDIARCAAGYVCKNDQCVPRKDVIDLDFNHLEARANLTWDSGGATLGNARKDIGAETMSVSSFATLGEDGELRDRKK